MQRVFVVEDDELLREAVHLILEQAGYVVQGTGVGRGAADLVRRFQPDLVLLDIRLPDTTGLQVLSALRAARQTMPIVMMTADKHPDTVREVMARGGNGYLVKPFEPGDLVERVRLALKQAGGAARV